MDLFSCNNCKRCRRRRTTSSGDETDRPTEVDGRHRHSTNLRRERITIINDCCAAAAMYFYAAPRRSGRGGRRQPEVVDTAPIDSLEMTASAGHTGCKRTSILKKSGDENPISVPVGGRSPSVADKRASFNEAVDVIVADDDGRPVVADSVRLKRSPELDSSSAVTTDSAAGQRRAKQAFAKMVFPPASRCRHAFQLASTDVERRADGSRYLRAVIRPAEDRQDDDQRVIVRAAGKGSRLVVGAYRPEPLGDGTNYLRQVRPVAARWRAVSLLSLSL